MRSSSSILLAIVALLLGVLLLQTRSYNSTLDRYRELQRRERLAASAEAESAELTAQVEKLRQELAETKRQAQEWQERSRERERFNSRLREELKRSATTIREMTATLDAKRREGT